MTNIPDFIIIREENLELRQAKMIVVKVDEQLREEIESGKYTLISDKNQYPIYMKN